MMMMKRRVVLEGGGVEGWCWREVVLRGGVGGRWC